MGVCVCEVDLWKERGVYLKVCVCVKGERRGVCVRGRHIQIMTIKGSFTTLHPFSETTSVLVNYHCNGRGSPEGKRSMPGLQEAADWMRNLTISGEEYCAAIMRSVSLFLRRLKSLGPWREWRRSSREEGGVKSVDEGGGGGVKSVDEGGGRREEG